MNDLPAKGVQSIMRASLVALVLVPSATWACINDRDTLAFELANKPDTQRALTGWFDRYPAKYYEIRIERLESKAKLSPGEIDDLAVAYERIGNSDQAIQVIERKQGLKLDKENQYTYFANRGTFYGHRWVAKRNPEDLRIAIADIRRAIQINPDAHFGRESAQLAVMEAISQNTSIANMVTSELSPEEAEQGLAGLIMLGAAWESPDVAIALGSVLNRGGRRGATAEMAKLRFDELLSLGRKPLTDQYAEDLMRTSPSKLGPIGERPIAVQFRELRAAADRRHKSRTDYILQRLNNGRHPDTDPTFWSDWQEPKMPKAASGATLPFTWWDVQMQLYVIIPISIIGAIPVGIWWAIRRRRMRKLGNYRRPAP